MVGKLVGQYSDSDRVSHPQQSLPRGAGRSEVRRVQRGEWEGGAVHQQWGEEIGSGPEIHCGVRLSVREPLQGQGLEEERRSRLDSPSVSQLGFLGLLHLYIDCLYAIYTEIHSRYLCLTPFVVNTTLIYYSHYWQVQYNAIKYWGKNLKKDFLIFQA